MNQLPAPFKENFHKKNLDDKSRKYSLGSEKLGKMMKSIEQESPEIRGGGGEILIPFGGPGSIAIYLSSQGWNTNSGDILYDQYNPEELMKKFQKDYNGVLPSQKFQKWDATSLPIDDDSQSLAIVNPPYGIECGVENPLDLCLQSSKEIERVLEKKGQAYYIFPKEWSNYFMQNFHKNEIKKILPSVSNKDSLLPLDLIKVEKM